RRQRLLPATRTAPAPRGIQRKESKTTSAPGSVERSRTASGRRDGLDRGDVQWLLRRLRVIEAVAAAIDDLLDGKERDQYAGEGDRGVKGGNRRIRRQTETAKATQVVQVSEIDEADGDGEHNKADDDLCQHARRTVHRLGKCREVEMIVASGRDACARKD